MIYWRAKYYYNTNNLVVTRPTTTEFDISALEYIGEGIFSIFTRYTTDIIGFNNKYPIGVPSVETSKFLESNMPLDFNYLYGASFSFHSSDIDKMMKSTSLNYPSALVSPDNLVSFYKEKADTISGWVPGVIIVIESLKRAFYSNSGASIGQGAVWEIDNGHCTLLGDASLSGPHLGCINSNFSNWLGIEGYDSNKPLSQQKYILFVGTSTTSGNYAMFTNVSNSFVEGFIKNLFPDGSKPDGENVISPENPYKPGGPSGPTDPDLPPGTFDDESDPILDSPLPTLSAANTGFTRIYNPTLSQVQALAHYLWTDPDVIQTIWNHIKQYFENPMEAMIGFNLVPVTVPDGGTTTFKLMYIDTGVSMTAAANQFVDTDCGTLKLEPYYGSAIDYSPYTKVSIFLPYIGMVSVDTDEVMGRTMQVKYRTDICSGACVAKILVDGNVLYQYTGHCAINIPFSAADFSSYVSAVMSTAKLAGTLALGASGALGPVAVSEITQQTGESITKTVNTERNPDTGRQITLSSITQTKAPSEITTTKASYAGISPSNVTNTVGEVISSKPHVEHSGAFSGTSGFLGVRRPYIIIKRPNMCMPANYQSLNGFPCMITLKLGDCKGFTRVQQVVLSKMGKATNPEQAEILGLLKNGVIL